MVSPILYTLMWILGGIIVSNCSHVRNDVSSLYAVGAHARWLFQLIAILCSVLLMAFYAGIHWSATNGSGSILGPVFYGIAALFGVLVACFFPLDAGGETATWRGKGHLVLIALSGVLVIAGMVFMYLRLRSIDGWRGFAVFQLAAAQLARWSLARMSLTYACDNRLIEVALRKLKADGLVSQDAYSNYHARRI